MAAVLVDARLFHPYNQWQRIKLPSHLSHINSTFSLVQSLQRRQFRKTAACSLWGFRWSSASSLFVRVEVHLFHHCHRIFGHLMRWLDHLIMQRNVHRTFHTSTNRKQANRKNEFLKAKWKRNTAACIDHPKKRYWQDRAIRQERKQLHVIVRHQR